MRAAIAVLLRPFLFIATFDLVGDDFLDRGILGFREQAFARQKFIEAFAVRCGVFL